MHALRLIRMKRIGWFVDHYFKMRHINKEFDKGKRYSHDSNLLKCKLPKNVDDIKA